MRSSGPCSSPWAAILRGPRRPSQRPSSWAPLHGSVRMIRGQLALHRGDTRKAIEHLEQAVKLLPRSVAAHSLLAGAYDGRRPVGSLRSIIMDSIEKLTAVTPEDYLFKGYAESGWDPRPRSEDPR